MRGSLGGSAVKKLTACWRRQRWFDPWVRKIPWRRKMATHSSILAWKIQWTGTWWATVHEFEKSRTWLRWLSRHAQSWGRRRIPISKNLWKPQTEALSFSERQVSLLLFKNKTCPNYKTNYISYLLLHSRLSPHLATLNNRHLSYQFLWFGSMSSLAG